MGKSLIIKGADFSEVAINPQVLVSNEQNSLGTNTYYTNSGSVALYATIESVQKISIPDGVSYIKPTISASELEPSAINCFSENEHLGLSGGTAVGLKQDLGTHGWYELLNGTKYISYVYKSSIQNFDMGLAITWVGK